MAKTKGKDKRERIINRGVWRGIYNWSKKYRKEFAILKCMRYSKNLKTARRWLAVSEACAHKRPYGGVIHL